MAVFPARAGMIRERRQRAVRQVVFPARAGMIPGHVDQAGTFERIPRESGDDPVGRAHLADRHVYSPRERG